MNIRKHIISLLETPPTQGDNLERLYNCLEQGGKKVSFKEFTSWFKGVIDGLHYKPNRVCLVLCGEEALGKQLFFQRLLFDAFYYCEVLDAKEKNWIYNKVVCHIDGDLFPDFVKLPQKDNFVIIDPEGTEIYPHTDKRLASYCLSTNVWRYPDTTERFIVMKLKSINRIEFNKISKMELWREIFHLYKQGKI